ncbi:hypothetical protein AAFF_G00183120 [Aldrovandia affinis]|uniref:Uncharacterized protein n=1 Tax=Aldrovandia affinis TaxID=143900 RepID=A0AAD7RKB5_9TELE|nr:hypothetical protein AAFF_G00183120 [Aldrovandia affinis]
MRSHTFTAFYLTAVDKGQRSPTKQVCRQRGIGQQGRHSQCKVNVKVSKTGVERSQKSERPRIHGQQGAEVAPHLRSRADVEGPGCQSLEFRADACLFAPSVSHGRRENKEAAERLFQNLSSRPT